MKRPGMAWAAAAALTGAVAGLAFGQDNPAAVSQQDTSEAPLHGIAGQPQSGQLSIRQFGGAGALLMTPVTHVFPGGHNPAPPIANPQANDPAAAQRGFAYFNAFNCVGCHAANGAGGMGRALTDKTQFLYGAAPANIYLTIVQGRPNGMPAWGAALPDPVIWDLVAYIEKINGAPQPEWGMTIAPNSPAIEQSPAEFTVTSDPWAYTEPFSNGQNPVHPGAGR